MNDSFDVFYNSSGVCTDTRKIDTNCLFICIKGDNFNGNTFAEQALKNGASHAIVDDKAFYKDSGQMTLVENSVQYLHELAHFHRLKFDIPVIGITGSNGKTTTKELIYKVLSEKYNVLATIGNLNNHLGVPFTLLRLTPEHEIAIIEMGANKPNDIKELCDIASPTHGIITNIGRAHLEGFKTFEGVLKTKKELYDSVEKNTGIIVFNSDDAILKEITPLNLHRQTYGTGRLAKIYGELISESPTVQFKWNYINHESRLISTKMFGKYNFYNYLAAIAFGIEFKVDKTRISDAIEEYTPINNRSQVKETLNNTLILDCYNANPSSTKSALESFAMNSHPNKLFILGDMRELGTDTEIEHGKIVELTNSLGLNGYVVGEEYGKLESPNLIQKFPNAEELVIFLKDNPHNHNLILLKGSRGIGLEVAEHEL